MENTVPQAIREAGTRGIILSPEKGSLLTFNSEIRLVGRAGTHTGGLCGTQQGPGRLWFQSLKAEAYESFPQSLRKEKGRGGEGGSKAKRKKRTQY